MKIKVELTNGLVAELVDYDASIEFRDATAGSEKVVVSIKDLDLLLPIMKGASSMYRQEMGIEDRTENMKRSYQDILRNPDMRRGS